MGGSKSGCAIVESIVFYFERAVIIAALFLKIQHMDIKKIKAEFAAMPHVSTVWVKDGNVFIHPIHGAEKVDLADVENKDQQPTDSVAKPSKRK